MPLNDSYNIFHNGLWYDNNGFPAPVSGAWVGDGVVVMGDSIPTYNFMPVAVGGVTDNGDGTATVTWDGATSLESYAGDTIAIECSPTWKLNVVNGLVLSQTIAGAKVTALVYRYAGGFYNDMGQTGPPQMRLVRRESDMGFLSTAKFQSDARFRVLANYTIGGLDSEQMEAMVDAATARKPRAICVQVGTNNVFARLFDAARSIASFKRIADKISMAGCIPVFGLILPRSDGQQNAASALRLSPVNRWMREYLPSVGGYCVDTWGKTAIGLTFADMASTIGAANAGMLVDGVHPARPGSWAMGKAWAAVMQQIFPARLRLPTNLTEAASGNGKLFFANPLLNGTGGTKTQNGGTITGTVPDGMSVTIVAGTPVVTLSQVARTEAVDGDAAGNNLRMVITGAALNTNILVRIAVTPGNWAHGDQVQAGARVKVSSSGAPGSGAAAGMSLPDLTLQLNTATSGNDFAFSQVNQNVGVAIDEGYSGILLTPAYPFKAAGAGVHGALGFIRFDLNLYFRGAGSATVDLSHPLLGAVNQ
jgi:hypothetical protein